MTRQQPANCKVLKLDRWELFIYLAPVDTMGAFLFVAMKPKGGNKYGKNN